MNRIAIYYNKLIKFTVSPKELHPVFYLYLL
jgi:hypothetical protein